MHTAHITSRRLLAALAVVALTTAACGSDADDAAQTDGELSNPSVTDPPAKPANAGQLSLATSDFGEILVDGEGNAVYLYMPDAAGEPTCYDLCEDSWPVVGEASGVGEGLDASLLGTVERTNGDVQATYNGWPLYYYVSDGEPGDVQGQGLGDNWYVLDAAGEGIS